MPRIGDRRGNWRPWSHLNRNLRTRAVPRIRLGDREINGTSVKVHRESDHAGNEEQKQAEAVEGYDFPVDVVSVGLPATLRVKESAAAGETADGDAGKCW